MNNKLIEIEKYAKDNNVPIMMSDGIEFLVNYIKEKNIKTILEIGSAIGYSAIKMALVDNAIKILTIEKDVNRYNSAIDNIKKFNLEKQVTIILGDALNINIEEKFDLIFIDAAKSKYIEFFEKYKKNLNSTGYIISDNLNFHGLVNQEKEIKNRSLRSLIRKINKYIEFLKSNKEFKTQFYDIGDGIGISTKVK